MRVFLVEKAVAWVTLGSLRDERGFQTHLSYVNNPLPRPPPPLPKTPKFAQSPHIVYSRYGGSVSIGRRIKDSPRTPLPLFCVNTLLTDDFFCDYLILAPKYP